MGSDCTGIILNKIMRLLVVVIISALTVTACSPYQIKDSAPKTPTRIDRTEKVVPKVEPKSKYGNPKSYVVFGKRYYTLPSSRGYVEQGIASWYGTKFHGRRTSSGETYDMYAMTAAHKTLPLPTYARVTNKKNGRSIIVRINDRGPFHDNRIIDLSYAAATRLGIVTMGTGLVEVRAIDPRASQVAEDSAGKIAAMADDGLVDVATPASNTQTADSAVKQKSGSSLLTSVPQNDENEVGIFVQIGAFRSQQNAYKLRNQFKAFQLGQLDVKTDRLEDSPIYKVRIGPMSTVEQADETVARLNQLGHMEYKLVFQETR